MNEKVKALTPRELSIRYQMVFSGEDGITVLSDILSLLGYFSNQPQAMDPKLLAVANTILARANVYNSNNVEDFVELMIHNAKPKEEEDEYNRLFGDITTLPKEVK